MYYRWVARGGSNQVVQPVQPVTSRPVNPVRPSSSKAGDETWNGRTLKLVFDDTFDGRLDTGKWEHEVSLWGGGVSVT